MQITVGWTTSTGTAGSNDFRPAADFINIPNGQNEEAIPLDIVADGIPEFSETFMVHLNSISGGARLGSTTSTTVTILPNDDPNGALGIILLEQSIYHYIFVIEFSSNNRTLTLTEPAADMSIRLTVNRNGGTTGIVSAQWTIIRSDGKYYHYIYVYRIWRPIEIFLLIVSSNIGNTCTGSVLEISIK